MLPSPDVAEIVAHAVAEVTQGYVWERRLRALPAIVTPIMDASVTH